MISIEGPVFASQPCNSCGDTDGVNNIVLRYQNGAGGTAVALCRRCRIELCAMLMPTISAMDNKKTEG